VGGGKGRGVGGGREGGEVGKNQLPQKTKMEYLLEERGELPGGERRNSEKKGEETWKKQKKEGGLQERVACGLIGEPPASMVAPCKKGWPKRARGERRMMHERTVDCKVAVNRPAGQLFEPIGVK